MRPAGIKSRAAFPAWPQPFIHRACNIFIGGCGIGSQHLPIRAARCASGHEIMSQPGCCQIQRQRAFIARVKRLHAWNLQESQIGFVGRRTCGQSNCNQANSKQAMCKADHDQWLMARKHRLYWAIWTAFRADADFIPACKRIKAFMPSRSFPDHDVNMRPAGIKSRAAFPAWPQQFIHRACNIFIGGCGVGSQRWRIDTAFCPPFNESFGQFGGRLHKLHGAFVTERKKLHARNGQ